LPDVSCVICDKCGRKCINKQTLQAHFRTHLEVTARRFKCKICPQSFNRGDDLENHELKHVGIKNFCCTICSKLFMTKRQMTRHITRLHNAKRQFQCDKCSYTATLKQYIIIHVKTHVKEKPIKTIDKSKVEKIIKSFDKKYKENLFKCKICKKSYSNALNLHRHQFTHIKVECKICLKSFSKPSIANHLKTHRNEQRQNEMKCKICSFKTFSHENFHRHQKTHQKLFKCEFCDRNFAENKQLKEHLQRHVNPNVFQCQICKRNHTEKRNLINHLKNYHS
jgi:KRAB domain-containing zinc finger protein